MGDAKPIGAQAGVLLAGAAEIIRWSNDNPGMSLDLRGVVVTASHLPGARLANANLSYAVFKKCDLSNADFTGAELHDAKFNECNLTNAKIISTAISTAEIYNSQLDNLDLSDTIGASQVRGLKSCYVKNRDADVAFDLSKCRFVDRFISWDRIRAIGQLRLFLPSYVALVISILVISLLSFLNNKIGDLRDLIASLESGGLLSARVTATVMSSLEPLSLSWRHVAVLISTLSLAVASTLYLFCPSRVREFTIDQWRYVADRPRFEYFVATWEGPKKRITCAISYGIGGVLAAGLVGDTFVRAIFLIIEGLH